MTEQLATHDIRVQPASPMAALYAALAKAQGAFLPIAKNRNVMIPMKSGGSYRFQYADLQEVLAKTTPALSANGLAIVQIILSTERGAMLSCMLTHAQGSSLESQVPIPTARDLGDPKTFGATITYLRRYMVTAMLGVSADDDLDEDGQENDSFERQAPAARQPAVAQPQRRTQAPATPQAEGAPVRPPIGDDNKPCTPGELAYLTRKLDDKGLTAAEARHKAGLDHGEALDGLTKAGFNAIKAVL